MAAVTTTHLGFKLNLKKDFTASCLSQFTEERESLTVAEETDRVYHGVLANARIVIHDGSRRAVALDNAGFEDCGTGH